MDNTAYKTHNRAPTGVFEVIDQSAFHFNDAISVWRFKRETKPTNNNNKKEYIYLKSKCF